MKPTIKEKIFTLFLCVLITFSAVKVVSKSHFYILHPSISIFLIAAIAVFLSNLIVTKVFFKRG